MSLRVLANTPAMEKPSTTDLTATGYAQLRYTDVNSHARTIGLRRLKALLSWTPSKTIKVFSQLAYLYGTHNVDDNRVWLEDLWVQQKAMGGRLTFGQLKPSFGLENMQSPTLLATMDRATVSSNLAPNGGFASSFCRDIGVQWMTGSPNRADLTIGLFTGTGAGAEQPMRAAGLLTVHGIRCWKHGDDSLQLGLSAAFRHDENVNFSSALPSTSSLNTAHFHGSDQRYNAELLAFSGRWKLQSELTYALLARGSGNPAIEAYGAYTELQYSVSPTYDAVLKAETFDPDTRLANRKTLHNWTVGWNINLPGNRHKIMLDYVLKSGTLPDVVEVQYQRTF